MLYTDGRTIGTLQSFSGVVSTVYPVVTSDGVNRFYSPNSGGAWYSWSGAGWVPSGAPPGAYRYVEDSAACVPSQVCGPCGPGGNAPLSSPGSVVNCTPVCIPPGPDPYYCTFTPCEPQIFKDCRHSLLFKDPYGGWMICKKGSQAWEAAEWDVCPTDLVRLKYSPSGGTYWQSESTGAVSYWDVESGSWLENNNPPCDLRPVFINLTTGKLFYYKVCRESDLRTTPSSQPFCSTGY